MNCAFKTFLTSYAMASTLSKANFHIFYFMRFMAKSTLRIWTISSRLIPGMSSCDQANTSIFPRRKSTRPS